jgi:hypothetical protein
MKISQYHRHLSYTIIIAESATSYIFKKYVFVSFYRLEYIPTPISER